MPMFIDKEGTTVFIDPTPDAITVMVERSFEDDVRDRDTTARLSVENVKELRNFLNQWLDKKARERIR